MQRRDDQGGLKKTGLGCFFGDLRFSDLRIEPRSADNETLSWHKPINSHAKPQSRKENSQEIAEVIPIRSGQLFNAICLRPLLLLRFCGFA